MGMGEAINIYFIAAALILAGAMAWGYWKGFIRIMFSLASLLIMTMAGSLVAPYMNVFLKDRTPLYGAVTEKCVAAVQGMAPDGIVGSALGMPWGMSGQSGAKVTKEGLLLPPQWSGQIARRMTENAEGAIGNVGIYQRMGEYLAEMIVRGISFALTFVIVAVALKLLIHFLNLVARLPVINGVNRLLGGIVGLAEGLLIIWALLFLAALACTTSWGQQAMASIQKNAFLAFLYQHNGIIYLVDYIFR